MCHVCWLQYLFSGEIFFIIIRVLRQWHQHQTHWSASADYCKHHQRHITSCWGGVFTDKVLAAEVHLYNEESSWLPAPGEQCRTQYLSRLISLSMMSMINTKINQLRVVALEDELFPPTTYTDSSLWNLNDLIPLSRTAAPVLMIISLKFAVFWWRFNYWTVSAVINPEQEHQTQDQHLADCSYCSVSITPSIEYQEKVSSTMLIIQWQSVTIDPYFS